MRAIDADVLKKAFCEECGVTDVNCKYDCAIYAMIDIAPTLEIRPVAHAEWLKARYGFYHCSNCGRLEEIKYDYCCDCGVKMDKENNNEKL